MKEGDLVVRKESRDLRLLKVESKYLNGFLHITLKHIEQEDDTNLSFRCSYIGFLSSYRLASTQDIMASKLKGMEDDGK